MLLMGQIRGRGGRNIDTQVTGKSAGLGSLV